MRSSRTAFQRLGLKALKPRLGMRMWSGIWPPSKPLMATPARAVWPLPPRPPVLPTPEPIPRPIRTRTLLAPGLSRSSFKRVMFVTSLLADDADEMRDLVDHAAHFGRINQLTLLVHLVEPEPDQGRALALLTADRRTDLLDDDGLGFSHCTSPRLSIRLRQQPRRGEPEVRKP